MSDLARLLLFLFSYVILMRWLLPWLGVPTCMSGECNVAACRKQTIEQQSEDSSNQATGVRNLAKKESTGDYRTEV
jgi:hypothetical protein